MLVGVTEATQVGDHDVGYVGELVNHLVVVVTMAWPAVQQDRWWLVRGSETVECQPKPIHGSA